MKGKPQICVPLTVETKNLICSGLCMSINPHSHTFLETSQLFTITHLLAQGNQAPVLTAKGFVTSAGLRFVLRPSLPAISLQTFDKLMSAEQPSVCERPGV